MREYTVYYCCDRCGGENISFDAYATWNVKLQRFDYDISDRVWCSDCEDDADFHSERRFNPNANLIKTL